MKHMTATVHAPTPPYSLRDTGLELVMCQDIMLKTMFRQNLTSVSEIAESLSVLPPVAQELIELARGSNLVETLGARGASPSAQLRYQMTETGRARAMDALEQSEYFGALPVTLEAFKEQTKRQSIRDVTITRDRLEASMENLILPEGMLDQLGPAVSSGKSMLLYGPPGNGKSSISNGIRDALGDRVFVPRCIEYAGQVISVYDPIVHSEAQTNEDELNALRRSSVHDPRYVLCRRPTVMTGGELTLDMLDLNYNKVSKTYQAPLQLKATGGVFIVDDLGRQQESPQSLINRWIVPMENGIDILSLQSGQKFVVPFDTLVIFSTNFAPAELFDGAALRRISYKVLVDGPSRDEFIKIFLLICKLKKIRPTEEVMAHLLAKKYPTVNNKFASYHAPFLIDQMTAICEYEQREKEMTPDLIDRAWENLFVADRTIEK